MRNKNHFDMEWFYKYWLANGGKKIPKDKFEQLINHYDINSIISFIDKKFNLTLLYTKQGQFIKVVD